MPESIFAFFFHSLVILVTLLPSLFSNCRVQRLIYENTRISHLVHLGNSGSVPRERRGRLRCRVRKEGLLSPGTVLQPIHSKNWPTNRPTGRTRPTIPVPYTTNPVSSSPMWVVQGSIACLTVHTHALVRTRIHKATRAAAILPSDPHPIGTVPETPIQ